MLAQIYDAVVAVDNDERITYLNAAAERQYQVGAAEVLGHPLEEIYQYRWMSQADEEGAAAALRTTGHWRGEYFHIRRDGVEFPVETSLICLRVPDGTPVGRLAVVRDISKRKRIERDLRRQSERLGDCPGDATSKAPRWKDFVSPREPPNAPRRPPDPPLDPEPHRH